MGGKKNQQAGDESPGNVPATPSSAPTTPAAAELAPPAKKGGKSAKSNAPASPSSQLVICRNKYAQDHPGVQSSPSLPVPSRSAPCVC